MQATPAKGKAAKAAAEAEDPDTVEAMEKVAEAIGRLPAEPGKFSLMEKQEGGGYQQGGDSVPPPQHGSKVNILSFCRLLSPTGTRFHTVTSVLQLCKWHRCYCCIKLRL